MYGGCVLSPHSLLLLTRCCVKLVSYALSHLQLHLSYLKVCHNCLHESLALVGYTMTVSRLSLLTFVEAIHAHAHSTDTRLQQNSPRFFKLTKLFFNRQRANNTEFVF